MLASFCPSMSILSSAEYDLRTRPASDNLDAVIVDPGLPHRRDGTERGKARVSIVSLGLSTVRVL